MLSRKFPPLRFADLDGFLTGVSGWIDCALPEFLPRGTPRKSLYDLAHDYPRRGGKRFRPALLLLCTSLVGGEPRRALPSAMALELFQNFALVHDDIEDDSLYRRGSPALHRRHGVPLALNAGDLLFGLVYEALLKNEPLLGPATALKVQRQFAAVFRRTFEGQAVDIAWCQGNRYPSRTAFEAMIRNKTGWYSGRGPCGIGALIGGGDRGTIAALGNFGELLGIGFQIRDDLLNLQGAGKKVDAGHAAPAYGKERGGDIAEGKRTLIVIEMLERLPRPEGKRLKAILETPPAETDWADVEWVIGRARASGALKAVARRCRDLGGQAEALLAALPASRERALLHAMTRFLTQQRES